MKRCFQACAIAVVAGCFAGTADAHHSTSLYVDVSKMQTVSGEFYKVDFLNPHTVLKFHAKNEKGETVVWSAETHSAGSLKRLGWKANMFKVGERVKVSGNPSRNGSPYMQLAEVVFESDGYVLSPGKTNPARR